MNEQKQVANAVLEKLVKAWNIHDAESFSGYFTKNGDFVNVLGQEVSGQHPIMEMHKHALATPIAWKTRFAPPTKQHALLSGLMGGRGCAKESHRLAGYTTLCIVKLSSQDSRC